jgi:hypothetical protein
MDKESRLRGAPGCGADGRGWSDIYGKERRILVMKGRWEGVAKR